MAYRKGLVWALAVWFPVAVGVAGVARAQEAPVAPASGGAPASTPDSAVLDPATPVPNAPASPTADAPVAPAAPANPTTTANTSPAPPGEAWGGSTGSAQPPQPTPNPAPGSVNTDRVNEDPTLVDDGGDSRRFYLALMGLGALHVHVAAYEFEADTETRQLLGGFGYELVGLIGGVGKELAIGGAVSFLHVPTSHVTYRGGSVPGTTLAASDIPERNHSIWVAMIGPGVDYRPGHAFRIGGTLGLAIASVPAFAWPSNGNNTVGGFGSTLWVGADWPVATHQRFGVLIKGAIQQFIPRNLDAAIDPATGSEVSVSLGLGVGLTFL